MTRRARAIARLGAALLAGALPPARAQAPEVPRGIVLSPEARQNLGIELARAERRDLHEVLRLGGMVRELPDRLAWVTPTARGQVVEVRKKLAEPVKKGEVLALLHAPVLERLRSDLEQGKDREGYLAAEAERVGSLVDQGILAERDRLRARAELALERSRNRANRRSVLLLGVTEEEIAGWLAEPERPAYLPVHAPIAGSVTARDVWVGELVETDRRLFRITDTDVVAAEAEVFERDIPRLKVGGKASLEFRPFPGWRFEGVLRAVSADLEPARRTARIWVDVDNRDGRLMPQMAVDITLILDSRVQVLTVPREAVLEEQGESFVYVANAGGFLRQPIVAGRRDEALVEVKEGLHDGDQVVTTGAHELVMAEASRGKADPGAHTH